MQQCVRNSCDAKKDVPDINVGNIAKLIKECSEAGLSISVLLILY